MMTNLYVNTVACQIIHHYLFVVYTFRSFLTAKAPKVIRKIIPSIETIGNSRDACKLNGKGVGQISPGL